MFFTAILFVLIEQRTFRSNMAQNSVMKCLDSGKHISCFNNPVLYLWEAHRQL